MFIVGAAGITPPDILVNEMFLKTIIILTVILPLSLIRNIARLEKVRNHMYIFSNRTSSCDTHVHVKLNLHTVLLSLIITPYLSTSTTVFRSGSSVLGVFGGYCPV